MSSERSASPARRASGRGGEGAPDDLHADERDAYQSQLQAKWKACLARDRVGFTGDGRLYQFGELTEELVEEVVQDVRSVWRKVSPQAVRSSLEAFHAHLLHRNVGSGNHILVGKRIVHVAAADLLGLPPSDGAAVGLHAESEAGAGGAIEAADASELLGEQLPGEAGNGDYIMAAISGEEDAARAAEPQLEEDIEVVLDEDEGAGGIEAGGGEDQAGPSAAAVTAAAKSLEPSLLEAAQQPGMRDLPMAQRQPASAPPHLGPDSPSRMPAVGGAAAPETSSGTGVAGAKATGRVTAQKAAPTTPSAGGPAKRRMPSSFTQRVAATASAQGGKKRSAADVLDDVPLLGGLIESMLAHTDSDIKRLRNEESMSVKLAAEKQAEAERLQEQRCQTERAAEGWDDALEHASTELLELAQRVEDIKRQHGRATSEISELAEQRVRLLKETEAALATAKAKAEAVAAKKREARQALERGAAKLKEIARERYS